MKLNDGYLAREIGNITVLLPVESESDEAPSVACYNQSAAMIVKCLEAETTEEAIVDALAERFEGSREDIAAGVAQFLEALRTGGILDETAEQRR